MISTTLPLTAFADAVTSTDGDWTYNVIYEETQTKFAELTAYNGTETTFALPTELDGCKIIGINGRLLTSEDASYDVIVPEGIEYITNKAFYNVTLKITLPSTLRFIGENAFAQAKIEGIRFPERLEGIGKNAFTSAKFENTDIVLPEDMMYLDVAFKGSNITSVIIGSKAQICGTYFSFPAGISEYSTTEAEENYNPFSNCKALRTVTVSKGNPSLSVTDNVLYNDDGRILVKACGKREAFTVPDSVKVICTGAFDNTEFEVFRLGKSIETIRGGQFKGYHFKKLVFPQDCTLKTIENVAFQNAVIDKMTAFPSGLNVIEKNAFLGATLPAVKFEQNSMLTEIGDDAFKNSVLEYADFSNCHYLYRGLDGTFEGSTIKKVNLGNTYVENLGDTFNYCTFLTDVILPETVTELRTAFADCENIQSINLDNVETIYESNFGSRYNDVVNGNIKTAVSQGVQEGYAYTEYENSVTITGYSGENTELEIPDFIQNKPVTEIGAYAFSGKQVTLLSLPRHLEKIREVAFADCGLSALPTFPGTLQYIGEEAFRNNSLSSTEMNEGLKYIGRGAFAQNEISDFIIPDTVEVMDLENTTPALASIYFGASIGNIESIIKYEAQESFYNKKGIKDYAKEMIVSEQNPVYSSVNGVLLNKDKTELLCYPYSKADTEYIIPHTVNTIASHVFNGVKILKKITVTENVSYIEDYAFENCENIETVIFTDNSKLKSLFETFYNCKNLKRVVFGKNMAITRMYNSFYNSGIKEIEIPSSVRLLCNTFYNTPLEKVTIHEGVEIIGHGTFRYTKLKEVVIPDSVKSIARLAFGNCSDLQNIDLGGARTLGTLTFLDCTSLTSIDLTGVRYDNSALQNSFKGCTNLTKLYFTKKESENYISEEDVADNETVETVVIGGGIIEIKSRAFANCKNLSVAMISDGVTSIDETAFDGCDNLTILCTEQSYAAKYAAKNSIRYTTLTVDSIPDQQYTGKAVKPTVTVKIGSEALKNGSDYSAQYSDNIKVGSAKVTVVGLGDYSIYGALARFNIVHTVHKYTKKVVKPTYAAKGYTLHTCSLCGKSYKSDYTAKLTVPKAAISKLMKKKKAFTVKWKKVSVATGYQIQYSTNKNFKSKKSVTVKSAKNVTKTVKKLKGNKKYYVRIRAYKTYKDKNYYSAWSAVKSVKTKN